MRFYSVWICVVVVIGVSRSEENFGDVDFCGGKRQSPINIRTQDLTTKVYEDLKWSKEYGMTPLKMISTGGGSLTIGTEYSKGAVPRISGGALPMPYKLSQFHFHWAQNDDLGGGEHRVNGDRFIMEMHAVHIKENMTFAEAGQDKDGIVVVGYLFEYSVSNSHAIDHLIETFNLAREANKTAPITLPHPFRINELLRPISCNYVTYRGSLTTRPCSENVRWIISPYVNKISRKQMALFRQLSARHIVESNNYRNLQDRNNRRIYYAVRGSAISADQEYPSIQDDDADDDDDVDDDDVEGKDYRANIPDASITVDAQYGDGFDNEHTFY